MEKPGQSVSTMSPWIQLRQLATQRKVKLRTIPGQRAMIHPDDIDIIEAVLKSHFENVIVFMPYAQGLQLHLSWSANIMEYTGNILGIDSMWFGGKHSGREWAIILEK
jgi:hypothetical protein